MARRSAQNLCTCSNASCCKSAVLSFSSKTSRSQHSKPNNSHNTKTYSSFRFAFFSYFSHHFCPLLVKFPWFCAGRAAKFLGNDFPTEASNAAPKGTFRSSLRPERAMAVAQALSAAWIHTKLQNIDTSYYYNLFLYMFKTHMYNV